MTPEAQRIAIAEACGWYPPRHPKVVELVKEWPHSKDREIWWLKPDGKEFAWITDVPDYLNDLNAMHEAEKGLTQDQREQYWIKLVPICDPKDESGDNSRWLCAHATAAQRAEAFLRTLELWKE